MPDRRHPDGLWGRCPTGQRVPTALFATGVVAVGPAPCARPRPAVRSPPALARGGPLMVVAGAVLALSGCGWVSGMFGDDGPKGTEVSVFEVTAGQCFATPSEVKAELANIESVPCDGPHRQEAYAVETYVAPSGGDSDVYPGESALASFADAICAQSFEKYVGVSYLNSSLYFTYLVPSARGWQESNDRSVICFVTTTGEELTSSVAGTGW